MESISIALIYELGPADDGSFLGGIESHIIGLAKELAKQHEVTLVTGMIPGAKRETEMKGFRLIRSDFMGLVERSWDPTNLTNARQFFSIPAFIKRGSKIEADVYHGHVYASGLVALELAGMKGASAVNTIHGSYYDHWDAITGSKLQSGAYRLAERILSTFLARKCQRQIHTATDFAEKVKAWGAPCDRVRVILNGVDTEKFTPSAEPSLEISSRPVVMTVRRLVPKNGVRFFLEASRHVTIDADFLIVGDGPQREFLEKLSKDLKVSQKVRFTGAIPNDQLPGVLASADILVVPSLVEASSISLLEAMSMGKPTIVANIPGIDEVAGPERSLMVPPGDPTQIARSIDLLLSDPGVGKRLGQRGREYVLHQRSEKIVAKQTLEIYAEALQLGSREE